MLHNNRNSADRGEAAEDEVEDFKPLTPQEAAVWRKGQRNVSIWRVVFWQVLGAIGLGLLVFLITGSEPIAKSAAYGGMSIAFPSAVMAYGMGSGRLARLLSVVPAGSLGSVVFWECVKVLLVVALLMLAPLVVKNLSWLALVGGLVVVLKVYWLAFLMSSRVKK